MPIEWHDELESTQTRALQWARAGAPEGSLVVARRQRSGRGRAGRVWQSPEGGLWCSLIVRPQNSEGLTLLGGLACARLALSLGVPAVLRWPNDVYVGERKLAGVLAEASGGVVVIGIGLNVNVREWADDLPATSLELELGHPLPLQEALAGLRRELEALLAVHESQGLAGYLAEVEARMAMAGRCVELDTAQGKRTGRVAGLEPSGALRLEDGSVYYSVERLRLVD